MIRAHVVLVVLSMVTLSFASSIKEKTFEGCFMKPYRSQGRSEFIFDNTNDKCVDYCQEEGFILAATHGAWCHCTQALPKQMLALKGALNATGPGTACGKVCPGTYKARFKDSTCSGDECCGGTYQVRGGEKWRAFSVYAVSGIPVVSQVKKRVKNNIDGHRLLWKIFDECAAFERIPRSNFLGSAPRHLTASSDRRCRSLCDREVEFPCVAYSYKPIYYSGQRYDGECELFRYITTTQDSNDRTLYIRRCFRGKIDQAPIPAYLLDARFVNQQLKGYLVTAYKNHPKVAVCHPEDSFKHVYNDTATVACRELGFLFGWYLPAEKPTIPSDFVDYNVYCDKATSHLSECIFHKVPTCKLGVVKLQCSTLGVGVTNKVLDLFLENFQRMIEHNPPTHIKPIDNTIEQDNTASAIPQSRSITKSTVISERAELNQETGFHAIEETSTSHEQEKSSETSFQASFSIRTTVTAEASYEGLFTTGGMSTSLSAGLSTSISTSSSDTTVTGETNTKEKTRMFEKGYSKSLSNDTTVSYRYDLDVPAFHKGLIAFYEETYPLILMWRAVFKLNGFIKLRLGPLEKDWHVSRLLTQGQRIFFTMNKLNTERKKIVAKIRIKDHNGKTVSISEDIVGCTAAKCTSWYGRCTERLCAKMFPCAPPSVDECLVEHDCLKTPEDLIEEYDYDWSEGDSAGGEDLFDSLSF